MYLHEMKKRNYMKKTILLLLQICLLVMPVLAQRRSTSVRGYTRKDGTYVRPHVRGYTAGSGSTSSYSYGNSSAPKSDEIAFTTLKFAAVDVNDGAGAKPAYIKEKGQKIALTTLNFINSEDDGANLKDKTEVGGIIFYVSVLRYRGKTLDICTITRSYGSWEFEKVSHEFQKKDITTEDALDLVSNYGWSISNDKMSKNFEYDYGNKGLPSFLTKTTEAIRVE